MSTTELELQEIANAIFNQNGLQSFARRLREKGPDSAHEHLIGAVKYGYKTGALKLDVAEDYYKTLEAKPEEFELLRQARNNN